MSPDPEHEQQQQRFREAVDKKEQDARQRAEQEESSLESADRPPDATDPRGTRAKGSGHGKKTADKWNQ